MELRWSMHSCSAGTEEAASTVCTEGTVRKRPAGLREEKSDGSADQASARRRGIDRILACDPSGVGVRAGGARRRSGTRDGAGAIRTLYARG